MKPASKLFLFPLIILLIFTTVPAVNAQPAGTSFADAPEIDCDDPALSYSGEIESPAQVPPQEDYYKIYLVADQKLIIDVDAEKIGSKLDSLLEVFDEDSNLVDSSFESPADPAPTPVEGLVGPAPPPTSVDPYLEIAVEMEGWYYLVISAANPEDADFTTGLYEFSLQCTASSTPDPVDPVQVGDLLGSIGAQTGSLLAINPADGVSNVRFPSVTGPIADIEYQYSTHSVFVAVDDIPGSIINIDPDTGVEGQVFNVDPGAVIALEDAAGILYGVHVVIAESGDPEYSLVTVNQSTGELNFLVSLGQRPYSALAYHSVDEVMYGVVAGAAGTDLVKIDLTSLVIEPVGPTGFGQVVALDFSHENVLYGVDRTGILFNIPDLITGQAVEIAPIDISAAVTALSSTAAADGVSGLTFVVGEPPDVEPIKIICSSTLASQTAASTETSRKKFSRSKLKNRLRRAIGLFKFQATAGENIMIRLTPEVDESVAAAEESSASEPAALYPSWKWKGKRKVFLGVRDSIPDVDLRVRKKDTLPMDLEVLNIPADGQYYVMVIRPLFRRFYHTDTDYCLELESDGQAWNTLEVAWPDDKSEENTTSTSTEAKTAEAQSNDPVDEGSSDTEDTTTTEPAAAVVPTLTAAEPVEETTVDETEEVVAPAEEPTAEVAEEPMLMGAPSIPEETTVDETEEVVAPAEEPTAEVAEEPMLMGAPSIPEETTVDETEEVVAPAEEPTAEVAEEPMLMGAPSIPEETTVDETEEVVAPAEEPTAEVAEEPMLMGAPSIPEETTVDETEEVVAPAEEPTAEVAEEPMLMGAPSIPEETTVDETEEVVAPAEEPTAEVAEEPMLMGAPSIPEETTVDETEEVVAPAEEPVAEPTVESTEVAPTL